MSSSLLEFKDYLVKPAQEISLSNYDASSKKNLPDSKEKRNVYVQQRVAELSVLQEKLYAQGKHKVLLILQGMDTAGKDGVIRSIFRAISPIGLRVEAFKAPTPNELAHDFLWRVHRVVPKAGEIVVFNRSHYEDVLIQKVLNWIDSAEEKRRLEHICHFEQLLVDTGTTIIKCYLHISKDEQRMRLQERIENPAKHWKFNLDDIKIRQWWDAFQQQYARVLSKTSMKQAPWYVIPANSKSSRDCVIVDIMLRTLQSLELDYPQVDTSDWPKIIE